MDTFIRFRWIWALLLVACIAAVSPGLPTAAGANNSLTIWFLETDPRLQTYQEFQDEFGNDEVILLLVENEAGIFAPEVLRQVETLSESIEAVVGIARVHSILTVQDAWDTEEGLVFHPLIPSPIPDDPELMENAGARALQNPLFIDRLVSADTKRTMVWAEMDVMADIDDMRVDIVAEVRSIATEQLGRETFAMGGIGVIYAGLNVITQHDFSLFLGIAYLLMFLLMWWIFRQIRIVAAAIGVISVGTIISLGVYGLLGHQMNMVTVVLPILVIVLGIADAVHMPTTFVHIRRSDPLASRKDVLLRTLRLVGLPSVLTTLTTMGSFLALTSSPMAVIRHLGIYSAIGIGAALVATFILMTLALHGLAEDYEPPEHRLLLKFLENVRSALETRRPLVAGGLLLCIALSAWGASMVEVDTYTIGYLPDDDPVVVDHERIEGTWGAYSLLEFVVRPNDDRRIDDPEVLAAMERFVMKASEHELIRHGFSIADLYRRTAAVYVGDLDEMPDTTVPLTPAQVEQLTLLFSMQRLEWDSTKPAYADNFMARLTNQERDLGRITLTGDMVSARVLEGFFEWLEVVTEETLGEVATVEAAGYPPLYVSIINYVMSSKIRGFFLALLIIFTMLLLGLRSLRLALISLPANIFPVLVMMGAMGFLGIYLDIATAMDHGVDQQVAHRPGEASR
ncbi:MAG: efflux RND transporter permease subunit, partial [Bradymonadaceae bacterium]